MKITILNMRLLNFKGTRERTVEFGDVTTITGDNETGKTTIFDAFVWLLWGKNSADAKDFNIKTLDKNNEPIHRLSHEVTATLDADGRHVTFRRVFKEKWTKKRGVETAELTGHETEFFVDDVPLSQSEYKARVDFIISEDIAKLVTNPLYFNQMKWNDRRVVLETMAGTVPNVDILDKIATLQNKQAVMDLTNVLNSGEKIDNYKRVIAAKKKKIIEEKKTIPTRIDESQRSMSEPEDWDFVQQQIVAKQKLIAEIDSQIENKNKAYERQFEIIRGDQLKLNNLKIELQKEEALGKSSKATAVAEIHGKINSAEADLNNYRRQLEFNQNDIQHHKVRRDELFSENEKLREQWIGENARELVIDEHKFDCPTCKQLLPEQDRNTMRETLTANFNAAKSKKLDEINRTGEANKAKIQNLEASIVKHENSNVEISKQIKMREDQLQYLKELMQSTKDKPEVESPKVADLKKHIDKFTIPDAPVIDNVALKVKKSGIESEVDYLKTVLATRDQITKLKTRIAELEGEESKLAQELAELERTEFTIEAFNRARIESIESRINGKFTLVRFKMFEQQINGGEVEACECMVNGVPYSDVNTASKINAGIDIINALARHYGMNAPVWIDNRESIIRILPCESQIINLVAVKDAPLTVTQEESTQLQEA